MGLDLKRFDPRRAAAYKRRTRLHRMGGFAPNQLPSLAAWLRLSQGTIVSGAYSSIPDLLASNPATQSVAAQRPTASTSANGLPIATFVRTSPTQMVWPIASNNNSTAKWGFACWVKITTAAFVCIFQQSSGANKVELYSDTNRTVRVSKFGVDSSGYNGRDIRTQINARPTDGTWFFLRYQFDGSQGTEANRDKVFLNEVDQSGSSTFSNVGTGGTPVTLRTASGNGFLGNYQDNTDPTYGLDGSLGPNIWVFNDSPSPAQGLALMGYDQPT